MDTMAAVAAEVAAALRISQGLAASRLRYARAMRERLPKTAEVFSAGDIGYLMFATIVYRTDLIVDPDVLAAVDAQLAANVARWPSMTKARLAGQVDKIVARADADAVRRRKEYRAQRQFWVGESQDGVCQIGGSLLAVDAHALDARLSALAGTVCEHDPRSREQRRADALGALAGGADRLGCGCGRADCAAGKRPAAPPVVIHLIAEAATINGTGSAPASQMNADGLITAELVAELAKTATLVPLVHPGDAPPEPGYAPSKALADFVRCRDLTCRWPGCDEPATNCDLDHTIPYAAGGPTHASNLKCYCRTHHLVKTFWGWRDQQLPDGTLILTSPSGHTYVSTPGSALLFPSLCHFSGGIPAPEADPPYDHCDQRTAMMPKRRRTRAQDRAYRIATERRQNHAARQRAQVLTQTAAATDTHGPPPDPNDDPPPFSNATVPLQLVNTTEPVVFISLNGGQMVPVLLDTGSTGLVMDSQFLTQNFGPVIGTGTAGYAGGLTYNYNTYSTTVDFGNGLLTLPTSVNVVTSSSPGTLGNFLSRSGAVGVLGIGPNNGFPGTSSIVTAMPGLLNNGVLIDESAGILQFGPNTLTGGITISGAPISTVAVQIDNGPLQQAPVMFDSGGINGTIPSALASLPSGGFVPAGTTISVYTSDGQTLLYSYTTTATNTPFVTSGGVMNTGHVPFAQQPIYVSYSPTAIGTTTFN